MAHLAADRSQSEDRQHPAFGHIVEDHLAAMVLLREAHDRLGLVADEHMIFMRNPGVVEDMHRRLEYAHPGIAMEIAQVAAAEKLRDVARQGTLDIQQMDTRDALAIQGDRLFCGPL